MRPPLAASENPAYREFINFGSLLILFFFFVLHMKSTFFQYLKIWFPLKKMGPKYEKPADCLQ